MKFHFYLFLLLLSFYANSQTVIIAKRNKDAIYVGADSRVIHKKNSSSGIIIEDTLSECKINKAGKYYFAIASGFIYEAKEIGKKNTNRSWSFKKTVNDFRDSMLNKLSLKIENLRINNLEAYKELKRINGGYISIAIFFGADKDSLFLEALAFKITTNEFQRTDIVAIQGSQDLFCAGHVDEILNIANRSETWVKGEIATINELIRRQMKNHPKEVGGAIDLIKITKKGTVWIQKKRMCN